MPQLGRLWLGLRVGDPWLTKRTLLAGDLQPTSRPPSRAPAEAPPPRPPAALPREPQDDIEFLDEDGEPPESVFMTQHSRQVRRVLGAGCWVLGAGWAPRR